MRNLVIYAITNRVNGKKYIGQTRQGLARRRGEHIYRFNLSERDHKLYLAMRKHGIENFQFDVLCHCLKPDYLDDLEVFFIKQFNTFNRGYNMTCGGDGVSDETRAKLSAAFKGRKITWYDKILVTRRRNNAQRGPRSYGIKGGSHARAKSYLVRFPDGTELVIKGLRQFCRDHDLKHYAMLHILSGRQRRHKGYSLIAKFND